MNQENNPAYPPQLARLESEWLNERRKAVNDADPSREFAGIGLSGGGIRSATICLGVFQALARHKLMHRVDYISSVSGGGYFAAFFGRLFCRQSDAEPRPNTAATVEALLAATPDSSPVRNLREFGRYIAPNGAGDIFNILAILLRNWLTIHLVLGIAFLAAFMLFILIRNFLAPFGCHAPYAWLLAVIALAWSIPCGWAYWIPPKTCWPISAPAWGLLAAVAFLGIILTHHAFAASSSGQWAPLLWALPTAVAACTTVAHVGARGIHRATSFSTLQSTYRNRLSRWLQKSLIALLAVLIIAGLEGAGRWLYLAAVIKPVPFQYSLIGIGTSLTAAFALIQRKKLALEKFSKKSIDRSIRKLVLPIAALGLWMTLLIGWSFLAHLLVYRSPPYHLFSLIVLVLLAWLMGLHLGFVNFSSHHTFYSARLTRAYLGASNPNRNTQTTHPLTESDPDDDIPMAEYFGWNLKSPDLRPCARGAPIFILNTTINETMDGRSSIQQLDRKGTSLAIGPCALSVGVRHHASPIFQDKRSEDGRPIEEFQCQSPSEKEAFKVFQPASCPSEFRPQRLTLGQWTAISGAAFSTGVGSKNNIFLSLLTGFANVRLGYWWYPGLSRPRQWKGILGTQGQLIGEMLARFPGTACREWYLSDGGHFENLGAYELLRRRLRRILLIDAEADPDYAYNGLLLLTRKARIDFGTTIRFLNAKELDAKLDASCRPHFGTLDDLRRPADRSGLSKVHAALATVEYPDHSAGDLLYLKPTLTGDEAPDVLDYHSRNPDFPHQPTADQSFDEAQWESHRALGLHIGNAIFQPRARRSNGWRPADLFTSALLPSH